MKQIIILIFCFLTSSCFAHFSFTDLSLSNQQRMITATQMSAAICTILSAYKITSGVFHIALFSPLRGMSSIGWGSISLCTAYTLFQWASAWQQQYNNSRNLLKN